MNDKRFECYFDNITKKWCVQNTDSLDMHYVADEPMGEEFAHILNLYQQTLDNVEKENEQLRKDVTRYRGNFREMEDVKCELAEENEQLKSELKIYRKVANCGNCHYHNYDWYDDGDEFEVCDKGNDMSDRICEDWEEL